jgi:hypothetical protein
MPGPTLIEVPFPMGGLNEMSAYRRQPEGTSPALLNVRPFAALGGRARGGQRAGLSRYFDSQVNGSNAIQEITTLIEAFDPSDLVADTLLFSEDFTQSDGLLDTTHWYRHEGGDIGGGTAASTTVGSATAPTVSSNRIDPEDWTDDTSGLGWVKDSIDPGSAYIVQFKFSGDAAGNPWVFAVAFRGPDPSTDNSAWSYLIAGVQDDSTAGKMKAFLLYGTSSAEREEVEVDCTESEQDFQLHVNANRMKVYVDNVLVIDRTVTTHSGQTHIGFGAYRDGSMVPDIWMDEFRIYTAQEPASLRDANLHIVSGGTWNVGDLTTGLSVPTGGSGAFSTSGIVSLQPAYQAVYGCDGVAANYKKFKPSTNAVSAWVAESGSLPVGGTSALTWDSITDEDTIVLSGTGLGLSAGDYFEIRDSAGHVNDYAYRIESVSEGGGNTTLDFSPDLQDATLTGDDRGDIYEGEFAARFSTLYRGRLVLYGLFTDPQNWFMSAVGDPLDWDYHPATTSATQAVAGTNADADRLGDVLTCCAPFSDDLMIMGGDHTLWVMRGDPAAGGVIDAISYETGIAGAEAYTFDPQGNFYFFGSGTVWRIGAGLSTEPEPLSRDSLERTFGEIDLTEYRIKLIWDTGGEGIHIFIVPSSEPSTAPYHYWFDLRTGSFWRDQFPAGHGPTAVHNFDADDPNDRALLLGGFDGYIRRIDDTATDDDGTAIESYVDIGPFVVAGDLLISRLVLTQAILAEGSDPVRLEVYGADTAENVVNSDTPRFVRTLNAGRSAQLRQRVRANAVRFRLHNDSATSRYWALESMVAAFIGGGKVRAVE